MSYKKDKIEKREYVDIPYTVVSHTPLTLEFTLTLQASGLKKLVEGCHDEDLIHITVSPSRNSFLISKYHSKQGYNEKKRIL